MLIKVIAFQGRMGQRLTLEEKIYIFKQRPDFLCLPEYFLFDNSLTDYHRAAMKFPDHLEYYRTLSEELSTCLIAGSLIEPVGEHLFNTCHIIDRGEIIGKYRKRFPVRGEIEKGLSAGREKTVIEVEGVRLGIMICGDVFFQHLFEEMYDEEVDVIFIPTTSPYRPDDSRSRKIYRDRKYFLNGAEISGAYVVKNCSVGTIFKKPLQGRSLITAPWGFLTGVSPVEESKKRFLTSILDISEIRDFRLKYYHRKNWQPFSENDLIELELPN